MRKPGQVVWCLIAVGVAFRVVLAFRTYGVGYDIDSFEAVRRALAASPLDVYSVVNGHPFNRWPYPPAFFVWISASGALAGLGPFHGWVQLPQIVADGAIAWFVQDYLRLRGADGRVRIAATALVALGPSFWIISGFHGQIDSLAILPAVAALWVWERLPPGGRRALVAGALIGLGASVKTVPLVMLIVLLPAVRSKREAVALVAPAVAVPLILLAPWLVADTSGTVDAFRSHRSLPGFGGLSLALQPSLADYWLHQSAHAMNAVNRFLIDHEFLLLLPVVGAFAALVFSRLVEPATAAALLWSALVVLNPGFEFHFVVWVLPFLLMAGQLRAVAVTQAVLFVPAAMLYWDPMGFDPAALYAAIMIPAWLIAAGLLVYAGIRATRAPRRAGPEARRVQT